MKTQLRAVIRAVRDELRAWRTPAPHAKDSVSSPAVEVFVVTGTGKRVLGRLSKEGAEFVFRYDPAFAKSHDAHPISAFPRLGEEYRGEALWPFFAVRLPPVERQDVQEALERHQISKHDVLRMLGELSGRAVASPYRFSLAPG
jgi:HipA-like protein